MMKKSIPLLTLLLVSGLYSQVNIDIDKLLERGGLLYAPNKEKPFSGSVYNLYNNGEYKFKGRYRSGLKHGKWMWWNTGRRVTLLFCCGNGVFQPSVFLIRN
jgi:antitoxin component YwqK of YwqJK toxin-antitoxin module